MKFINSKMLKIKKVFLVVSIFVFSFLSFNNVLAQPTPPVGGGTAGANSKDIAGTISNLTKTAKDGGYKVDGVDEQTLPKFVGSIIQTILGLLGVLFAILIIYAGILWMMADGDGQEINKSKGIIKNSIIGLAIVLSAMVVTRFIANVLSTSI